MNENKRPSDAGDDENRKFLIVFAGAGLTLAAAFAGAALTGVPIFAKLQATTASVSVGVVATGPLLRFLWWFSKTDIETIREFRDSQIAFFSDIGFEFTTPRILLLALAAGVSEELLFRGFLQEWASVHLSLALAVVLPNILFGLLHWRTALYAFIAGIVGVYLGVIYAATDNLLAPMITHTLYDVAALEYTRRAVNRASSTSALPPSPDSRDRRE